MPPDRWQCPLCHNIIEEIVYVTLPRQMVKGPAGKYTAVKCPVCHRSSPGIMWRVVEVTGTGAIV